MFDWLIWAVYSKAFPGPPPFSVNVEIKHTVQAATSGAAVTAFSQFVRSVVLVDGTTWVNLELSVKRS